MKRHLLSTLALVLAISFGSLSCANDHADWAGGEVTVRWHESANFTQFRTFGIVTEEQAGEPQPDIPEDVAAFNDFVNELIRDNFIELGLTESDDPDVWAGNVAWIGEEEGVVWVCVPGYWWGYWGWYWDPCKWEYPEFVTYEVGTLLIPVGQASTEEPVFVGAAKGVEPSVNTRARVELAVDAIFARWPSNQTGN